MGWYACTAGFPRWGFKHARRTSGLASSQADPGDAFGEQFEEGRGQQSSPPLAPLSLEAAAEPAGRRVRVSQGNLSHQSGTLRRMRRPPERAPAEGI